METKEALAVVCKNHQGEWMESVGKYTFANDAMETELRAIHLGLY